MKRAASAALFLKRGKLTVLYLIIAAAVCTLDQLLKLWVTVNIGEGGVFPLIPGFIHLTYLRNTGAAFSMFSGHTWVLACVSLAAVALLTWLILKKDLPGWEKVGLALVLGGAAGNGLDRVFLHYVVDMFEVEFTQYAVFNLADMCIDTGAALFCLLYIIRSIIEERRKKRGVSGPKAPEEGADGSDKKD